MLLEIKYAYVVLNKKVYLLYLLDLSTVTIIDKHVNICLVDIRHCYQYGNKNI